ncbi:hypothetical protein AMAG_17850 [Allomyces macrogynus ATCC 38327]|uniref:Uncharacterized protein n=1 Tax=Allomyces macrogynus (strain ATCC 38327) TaxID=578462 RepID=A0A0L0S0Q5_ALLM3|nr:hypothetical protein AMAG_17850 [Allomyces macrogynus ATCC 38327]|eukprot:KNE55955.1 hypothetical protein AMAG_17850 [Allomyces macrogynus ATCC 38327]
MTAGGATLVFFCAAARAGWRPGDVIDVVCELLGPSLRDASSKDLALRFLAGLDVAGAIAALGTVPPSSRSLRSVKSEPESEMRTRVPLSRHPIVAVFDSLHEHRETWKPICSKCAPLFSNRFRNSYSLWTMVASAHVAKNWLSETFLELYWLVPGTAANGFLPPSSNWIFWSSSVACTGVTSTPAASAAATVPSSQVLNAGS